MKPETVKAALKHLRASDPVMNSMISDVGSYSLRLERNRFAMLVKSIISQQLSTAAARTIRTRLEEISAPERITPEMICQFDVDDLRAVGVSKQKATYILELASQVRNGTVSLNDIGRKSDEAVISHLTQVRGIGRWTAQMFLIFSLGRPNVFPADDLGVRAAIKIRYGYAALPSKEECWQIARDWQPYASIASWYCWRCLDPT